MGANVRDVPAAPTGSDGSLQEALRRALDDIRGLALLDGVEVSGTFAVATKTVQHSLGRAPTRVVVMAKPGSTLGYYTDAHTKTTIDITVAAAGDWVFWVF